MIGFLIEFFAEIGLEIQQLLFLKKRKERRAYERENNLPKKRMISPFMRTYIVVFILSLMIIAIVQFNVFSIFHNKNEQRLIELRELLLREKTFNGTYPNSLEEAIRNNPLHKHLLKDHWGSPFYYKIINKNEYILKSLGKDKTLNTEDDIE